MMSIKENLQLIENKISTIAQECDRDPKAIKLIAVSKTKPVSMVTEAINAGHTVFGENYVQEGIEKIQYFKENLPKIALEWHFIGPLQSNKSKLVAGHFDWIHTVDRLKIAERLNQQRPAELAKLNVLIQINISNEESKSGINPSELEQLAKQITLLPNLKLRGLMAIPEVETTFDKQIETFNKMDMLYKKLQGQFKDIDTLSMGMSDDMRAAIIAGSTMVRIGTAIFGARQYN